MNFMNDRLLISLIHSFNEKYPIIIANHIWYTFYGSNVFWLQSREQWEERQREIEKEGRQNDGNVYMLHINTLKTN